MRRLRYNPTRSDIRMHHLIRQIPDSGNQMVHLEMHPTQRRRYREIYMADTLCRGTKE